MRRLALLSFLVPVCYLAGAAWAGGIQVELVPLGRTLWVTGSGQVSALDSRSGRVLRNVPVADPYPIWLARGGGAVWVGSVENGFVAGAVTRIGADGVSTPLRLPHSPLLDLTAGGGAAWALAGPWAIAHLVRIDFATGHVRRVALGGVRMLAGDGTTAVALTAGGRLFRLGPGVPAPVGREPPGATLVTVALGGVWALAADGLRWVDLRDGRGRTILGGRTRDAAFGGGEAYALRLRGHATELVRFDQDGGRVYARRSLPPDAVHVAFAGGAVWVAEAGTWRTLVRLDPRTLAIRGTVRLP